MKHQTNILIIQNSKQKKQTNNQIHKNVGGQCYYIVYFILKNLIY